MERTSSKHDRSFRVDVIDYPAVISVVADILNSHEYAVKLRLPDRRRTA